MPQKYKKARKYLVEFSVLMEKKSCVLNSYNFVKNCRLKKNSRKLTWIRKK